MYTLQCFLYLIEFDQHEIDILIQVKSFSIANPNIWKVI